MQKHQHIRTNKSGTIHHMLHTETLNPKLPPKYLKSFNQEYQNPIWNFRVAFGPKATTYETLQRRS